MNSTPSQLKIIITTFMREDKQKAVYQIPELLHEHVYMFTREDRVEELRKHVPSTIRVIGNPMDIDGIADIRQRCIEQVPKGKVWFIDDLCTFGWRDHNMKQYNDMDTSRWFSMYKIGRAHV